MSKKVFSIYEWYLGCNWDMPIDEAVREHTWVLECEGKEKVDCYPYLMEDLWFVNIEEYIPYKLPTSKEDTFVINLQLTRILERDSFETPLPNEVIGENIEILIERLLKSYSVIPFDDVKVTGVQHFERDLGE